MEYVLSFALILMIIIVLPKVVKFYKIKLIGVKLLMKKEYIKADLQIIFFKEEVVTTSLVGDDYGEDIFD